MSAKDDLIAAQEIELDDFRAIRDNLLESWRNCQSENMTLVERNRVLESRIDGLHSELEEEKEALAFSRAEAASYKKRVELLEAALTFADARINHMMEASATNMAVTNNYHIGRS